MGNARWTNEIPAGFFSHQCCAAVTSSDPQRMSMNPAEFYIKLFF
jgi:hypothetical protein